MVGGDGLSLIVTVVSMRLVQVRVVSFGIEMGV